MKEKNNKSGKIKNFFKTLTEKLDKKLENKSKQAGCCCSGAKPEKHAPKGKGCCGQ